MVSRHRAFPTVVLLAWAGSIVLSASTAGGAEPARIGALTEAWGPTPQIVGLRDGLAALGYRENAEFVLGVRFTQGDPDELQSAARGLVGRGTDLIFASNVNAALAARKATERVPIVFAGGGDPVKLGLVASLARPGGRVTGVTDADLELAPKRLELLHQIVPGLRRVLFVHPAGDEYALAEAQAYREAARRLGLVLVERPVRNQDEARMALAGLRRGEVDGLLSPRFLSFNIPGFTRDAGAGQAIPSMFSFPFFVEEGGLVSYAPSAYESGRQAARLVAKILKGEKPEQIPVEANSRIELVVNMKAARALGLKIPPQILLRANRVLE